MLDIAEILDFCDFLSPTPEEQAARSTAVKCVFDVIKHIWPHSKVRLAIFLSSPHPTLSVSCMYKPECGKVVSWLLFSR